MENGDGTGDVIRTRRNGERYAKRRSETESFNKVTNLNWKDEMGNGNYKKQR